MTDLKWGTIWGDDDKVHLVPCDDCGKVMAPHVLKETCECHPEIDSDDGIVTHAVIQ